MNSKSDLSQRGQHSTRGPAVNNGQKTKHERDTQCGQLSGGELHTGSATHRIKPSADISTAVAADGKPLREGKDDEY